MKAESFAKGDMYWYDFGGEIGPRPAFIVSRERCDSNDVTVAMMTDVANIVVGGAPLKYPYQALVYLADCPGLDCNSVVKCDRLFTVLRTRMCQQWYIGKADPKAIARVDAALVYAMDLQGFMHDFVVDAVDHQMGHYVEMFGRR